MNSNIDELEQKLKQIKQKLRSYFKDGDAKDGYKSLDGDCQTLYKLPS